MREGDVKVGRERLRRVKGGRRRDGEWERALKDGVVKQRKERLRTRGRCV